VDAVEAGEGVGVAPGRNGRVGLVDDPGDGGTIVAVSVTSIPGPQAANARQMRRIKGENDPSLFKSPSLS